MNFKYYYRFDNYIPNLGTVGGSIGRYQEQSNYLQSYSLELYNYLRKKQRQLQFIHTYSKCCTRIYGRYEAFSNDNN